VNAKQLTSIVFGELKKAGERLKDSAPWYQEAIAKVEEDAQALAADYLTASSEADRSEVKRALTVLLPNRKDYILAAVEARAGQEAKALFEGFIDLGAGFLIAALKHI
jgi:hypothetical protein